MLEAELPASLDMESHYLIDIDPPLQFELDPNALPKQRSTSSRQSETSKKRRNFISGVGVHRISQAELVARREYMDEWYARARDNE